MSCCCVALRVAETVNYNWSKRGKNHHRFAIDAEIFKAKLCERWQTMTKGPMADHRKEANMKLLAQVMMDHSIADAGFSV